MLWVQRIISWDSLNFLFFCVQKMFLNFYGLKTFNVLRERRKDKLFFLSEIFTAKVSFFFEPEEGLDAKFALHATWFGGVVLQSG